MTDSEPSARPRAFLGLDAELGPARPLTSVDAEWLVEQVVERALVPAKRPRSRILSLRSLSLAALAIVTSAAAATVVHQRFHKSEVASSPDVAGPQLQSKKHAPVRSLAQPTSEPIAETAPSAVAPAPLRVTVAPTTNSANAISAANEVTAVDRLSAANELRRKAQWQAAEAAYRDVAVRYPQAQEAQVAELAAAELRLEHLGDAAGALRLYQSVPQSSALGVEALFGVSRAERALGDGAAETTALRALLDAYPTSLQADSARERLKQLAAETTVP